MSREREFRLRFKRWLILDTANYAMLARKYNIDWPTLSRHARGVTRSGQDVTSDQFQLLTNKQERFIIDYINNLSNQGLYVIPKILTNLVEDLLQHPIGKKVVYLRSAAFTLYYKRLSQRL
jgi:hypothetical protein